MPLELFFWLYGRDIVAVIIMHIRFQLRGIFIYLLKQISFRSRHWHITGKLLLSCLQRHECNRQKVLGKKRREKRMAELNSTE